MGTGWLDDEEGRALLHMFQQRAESWCVLAQGDRADSGQGSGAGLHVRLLQRRACSLVRHVLIDQDHWVLDRMKRRATRLSVISVRDIDHRAAKRAILRTRARHFEESEEASKAVTSRLLDLVGGRIAHIHRFAAREGAAAAAQQAIGAIRAFASMLTAQMMSASTC